MYKCVWPVYMILYIGRYMYLWMLRIILHVKRETFGHCGCLWMFDRDRYGIRGAG